MNLSDIAKVVHHWDVTNADMDMRLDSVVLWEALEDNSLGALVKDLKYFSGCIGDKDGENRVVGS